MARSFLRLWAGGALSALVVLAACSQPEEILPGEREPVRPVQAAVQEAGPREVPIRLPASRANADWTHLNGDPTHLAPPVALGQTLTRVWSTSIGQGSGKRERLTASPVVAGGVIYTLDAASTLTAVSTDGSVLWNTSLVPDREKATEGFGGGIAIGSGVVIVTTGFAEVLRIDPATGGIVWRNTVEGAVRAAPTLGEDKAIVVARGDLAYGIDLETGNIDWRIEGVGRGPGVVGGSSPAVRGPLAVLPFQSGEVRGVLVRNGLTVWTAAVTGGRRELARSTISDIAGDPVIDNDIVYVANQAGRLVSLDRRSGERLWTHREGSFGPALPLGNSVFFVSDRAELMRINASDGSEIWRIPLPGYDNPDRRRRAIPHFGPLLAGGRLLIASGDGIVRSFDPSSGALVSEVSLPAAAAAQPAIAGGRMYVVTDDGTLHAFQ